VPAEVILPRESAAYEALRRAALERRCVFFAGLSGVGKSLLLQQLALLASKLGRSVHLLQWDVARGPFETPAILACYPEVDGVTHVAIRKAVGLWARDGVRRWHGEYPDSRHLLIGELPLIGNRLLELAKPADDEAETLLAGPKSLFFIPVPCREVRQVIEASRAREMASPRHERDRANAAPTLLQAHWREIERIALQLNLARPRPAAGFDPDVYAAVYRRLLRHRRTEELPITSLLPVRASPHDLSPVAGELIPTADDVERTISQVEHLSPAELQRVAERWFDV